jgi:regulator of protease activity HflC (stomatin/prohibitin superfamily)
MQFLREGSLAMIYVYIALAVVVLLLLSITIVRQGTVGVSVLFGKYFRILRPGLTFKIPLVETVFKRISLQHRSVELEFQAITIDQANVNFKTLILYAVENDEEETICRAAFKFIDDRSLMQALIRSIEGSVRSFVATRKQNEVLSLRREIVMEVKSHIDEELKEWGFHLINLQVNDISFDEAIMRSMAQVVATNNMKAAAENEAQAQYISKTRVAQAEAESKRLIAQAEKEADQLRGEGNALLRENIAQGLAEAEKVMALHDVDRQAMLFTMWLDSMKYVAAHGHGNIISFDGSNDGFDKTWKQMSLLSKSKQLNGAN